MSTVRSRIAIVLPVAALAVAVFAVAASPSSARGSEHGDRSTEVSFGHYQMIGGVPYAVPGETWTFDHGAPDPLEGWTSIDRWQNEPHFRKIDSTAWSGHGNGVNAPVLIGTGSLWIGLHEDEADALCWEGGLGYGNYWDEEIMSPPVGYDGSGVVSFSFRYWNDTDAGSDSTTIWVERSDGARKWFGGLSGTYGDPSSGTFPTYSGTIPSDFLSGTATIRLIFRFHSDELFSDEDGNYPTDHGAFGVDDVLLRDNLIGGDRRFSFDSPLGGSADWISEANQAGAFFGIAVATAGDVNGDGYSDVIVGASNYDNGETDEGRAFLFLGSASGLAANASWMAEGNQAGCNFGNRVAAAGDVNNDGFDDVVVVATSYDSGQTDEGKAYLYLGASGGLSAAPSWTAEGNQTGALLGQSVGAAGDVNGDGYGDLIVGVRSWDGDLANEGRALVYHGSASGLAINPIWVIEGNQAGAELGYASAGAGDVNGDGFADVIVGAYLYDNGQSNEGLVGVFHGSASGLSFATNWTAESNQASAWFGGRVGTAGDVNDDGYDDVIIGARLYDNGETDEGGVFAYYGSASGLSATASWVAEGNQAGASLGRWLGTADDVNGDGYADVILGAFAFDNGETDEGRVFVYTGSVSGLSASAIWTVESDQSNAQLGYSVGTAGDVNGDGYSDVIIGAYGYDAPDIDEGRAQVFHGGADHWNAQVDPSSGVFVGTELLSSYTFDPPLPAECSSLSGRVLEAHDANNVHPDRQFEVLYSPIVDKASYAPNLHEVYAEFDCYRNLPPDAGVAFRPGWRYYPWTCPATGAITWSPRVGDPIWVGGSSEPSCTRHRFEGAEVVPASAQKIQFMLEVVSSCELFGVGSCANPGGTPAPLFDNLNVILADCGQLSTVTARVKRDTSGFCQLSFNGPSIDRLPLVLLQPIEWLARASYSGSVSFSGLDPGDYTISLLPRSNWTTCPPASVQLSCGADRDSILLGERDGNVPYDLAVSNFNAAVVPVTGQPFGYFTDVINVGTQVGHPEVRVLLPTGMVFDSTFGTGFYESGTHSVSFPGPYSLGPNQALFLAVWGHLTAPAGADLVCTMNIDPTSGDAHPEDNSVTRRHEVVASQNPAMKFVSPSGPVLAGTRLYYQIFTRNFDPDWLYVDIMDVIDPNLDLSTFRYEGDVGSNRTVNVVGRELRAYEGPFTGFDNYFGSQGFVSYSVCARGGLADGTLIRNVGRVRFWGAPEILTNETVTVIGPPVDVAEPMVPLDFGIRTLRPNPTRGSVSVQLGIPVPGVLDLDVYDAVGRRVRDLGTTAVTPGMLSIAWDGASTENAHAPSGIYFVRGRLHGADGRLRESHSRVLLVR